MSKKIPVCGGYFAIVDDEDYERLSKYSWHIKKNSSGSIFYARTTIKGVKVRMHHLILIPPPGKEVDHIDHNGLNNQKENLRIASSSQNKINTNYKNKSGFRGVYPSRGKRWYAEIWKSGEKYYLGIFDTKQEAAMAYNEKAIELHGEFAVLNIIK